MSIHQFGEVDGHSILEVTIGSAAGATAKIISWGSVLRDLEVPSPTGRRRVVLGFDRLDDYLAYSPYFGANVGRYANRISRGRFALDGREYSLDLNDGRNTLHGGFASFGKRPWKLGAHDATSVTLTLHSPDGDGGFPGNLDATCTYRFIEPAILRIEMSAVTDATTIVNLAHHSYFNLDGSTDVRDHELTLHADFYTPVDEELIPTGEIRAVAGTPYDFRTPRRVRVGDGRQKYDTNFVLSRMPDVQTGLAHAATLRASTGDLTMEVHTTEPGVQFYDGAGVNCPVPGLGGITYGAHAGLCLEAQVYPDSPNRRHFPRCILRADDVYGQVTDYRFA
jgi:aldose 1-epimerase